MGFQHETVLLNETIDGLDVNPRGVYVDCTLGGGGHLAYLLTKLSPQGRIIAFDQDMTAIRNAQERFKDEIESGQVMLIHANFAQIKEKLAEQAIHYVDGIYYDLGVSSPQLDVAERGFSYHKESRLDMRMDQSQPMSAYELVNEADFNELQRIIAQYGEERFAKRIARAIERERELAPIETTTQLADIVKEAIPAATRRTGGHPAKRTFQALRITVNNELGVVEDSLEQALSLLKVGGRLAVITFHSLEDRIVKQLFKKVSTPEPTPRHLPILPEDNRADYHLVTRKPILPLDEELQVNNRSRSAKLRIIERDIIEEP